MFSKKKHNDKRIGKYPSNDMLNNALRSLIDGDIKNGMSEILYAIAKADGYICDDVKEKLMEYDEFYKRYFKN